MRKKNKIIVCFVLTLICITLAICLYIYTRPVSWDAAACAGGYSGYIFDKYKNELAEEYARSIEARVIDVGIVEDSYDVQWEGKKLYVELTIWHGEQQQRVTFTGQRKWIDTYEWVEISAVPIENKTYSAQGLVGDRFYMLSEEVDVTSINEGIRAGFGDWGAVRDLE